MSDGDSQAWMGTQSYSDAMHTRNGIKQLPNPNPNPRHIPQSSMAKE